MYTTTGIDAVANLTELRAKASELIEHIRESGGAILIQMNNDPSAVLMSWETYQRLTGSASEGGRGRQRAATKAS